MAYEKIGWKDYPDKTTPMNAKNFTHMDEGIFANSVAIGDASKIESIGDGTCAGAIESCFQSVSDGKAAVATALTNQGVATASDATFATMATNVTTAGTIRYNAGVAAADARVNTSSASYTNGYNAGVTAADNRANGNSVNYQTGYTNGYNAGVAAYHPSTFSDYCWYDGTTINQRVHRLAGMSTVTITMNVTCNAGSWPGYVVKADGSTQLYANNLINGGANTQAFNWGSYSYMDITISPGTTWSSITSVQN